MAIQDAENDDVPLDTNLSGLSDTGQDLKKLRRWTWMMASCGSRDLDRSKAMVIEVLTPACGGSKEIEGEVMMLESSSGVLVPIEEDDDEEDELDDEDELDEEEEMLQGMTTSSSSSCLKAGAGTHVRRSTNIETCPVLRVVIGCLWFYYRSKYNRWP